MFGYSTNKREIHPRKCFWTEEKETRIKIYPRVSANRPLISRTQSLKRCDIIDIPTCSFDKTQSAIRLSGDIGNVIIPSENTASQQTKISRRRNWTYMSFAYMTLISAKTWNLLWHVGWFVFRYCFHCWTIYNWKLSFPCFVCLFLLFFERLTEIYWNSGIGV